MPMTRRKLLLTAYFIIFYQSSDGGSEKYTVHRRTGARVLFYRSSCMAAEDTIPVSKHHANRFIKRPHEHTATIRKIGRPMRNRESMP